MAIKGLMESLPKHIPNLEEPYPICILIKENKPPIGPTIDVSKFAPGFMLQMDFEFSMLKASVDLPRLLWIYVMLLHTPLDVDPDAKVCLFTS